MPDNDGKEDKDRFTKKMTLFLRTAHASLKKHLSRWIGPSLLPAALISEAATAKVIAAIILDKSMPTFDSDPTVKNEMRLSGMLKFRSDVHDQTVDLVDLNKFLRRELKDVDAEYRPQVKHAAHLVAIGVDMRSFDYQDANHGVSRWFMHSTYLPLPHQTQFVESAVKESKNVSSTDRSEQLRTCLAIIRSPTPLSTQGIKEANKNKVLAIIQSARDRTDPHEQWMEEQEGRQHNQRFNVLLYTLSQQGHFKNERIDSKKLKVDEQGSKYKRQNRNQMAKQQHMTSAVTGLIPYSKVTKKRNMEDVVKEILHRQWQLNYQSPLPNTMPLRKDLLKKLETIRLIEEESMAVDAAAEHKSFLIQSDAEFKMTDD